ncbi:FAD-dependent monooxygenase [Streptosporangium sp. NPDC000509]|uniref:FAD-dependent monooxygenase n=1 Tax=Streptosporangium sp. NPDC000509 TaxID=3366186 RepID=UPI003691D872
MCPETRAIRTSRRRRVRFAGDAAHVHSPAGGHGMNIGIPFPAVALAKPLRSLSEAERGRWTATSRPAPSHSRPPPSPGGFQAGRHEQAPATARKPRSAAPGAQPGLSSASRLAALGSGLSVSPAGLARGRCPQGGESASADESEARTRGAVRRGALRRTGVGARSAAGRPERSGNRKTGFARSEPRLPGSTKRSMRQTARTCEACGPFWPWVISNSTRWPSSRLR